MNNPSISLPPDWTTQSLGKKNALFVHEKKGLKVGVRAVHSASRTRRKDREPTHYVISLRQDWFARGTLGERNMAAKVDTWDEALATAQEFMREFSREEAVKPIAEIEATHRAVDDHGLAEDVITTEIAAEALADAAGYSDDLLLSVLAAETNGQYGLVVHREGNTLTIVADSKYDDIDTGLLKRIHAVFPIDPSGIRQILSEMGYIATVTHHENYTIHRFIFDDSQETDIVLPSGTQVLSPEFETTVANVLEERW